jgi:phage shock protein C
VRIAFVIAAFGWGSSILAYILLWIIVPQKPFIYVKGEENGEKGVWQEAQQVYHERSEEISTNRHTVLGSILIGLGAIWLFGNFIPDFDASSLWPLALVGLGLFIIFKTPRLGKQKENTNEV